VSSRSLWLKTGSLKAGLIAVEQLSRDLETLVGRSSSASRLLGLQTRFAESHAAAVKHTVIKIEKTIGRIKRWLQLTTVMAAKQRARDHTVTRMTAKVSAGRPPSCHANTAANR
jgi:hypothetical protein